MVAPEMKHLVITRVAGNGEEEEAAAALKDEETLLPKKSSSLLIIFYTIPGSIFTIFPPKQEFS